MNLEDPLLRPVSTPPSTYVAVARGTVAPGDQPRERRGSHRDRSPPKRDFPSASFSRDATGKEQPRADTPAPVRSRDARLNTTAVHLRLALPQVRAALRQLRDICAAHAEGSNAVVPSSDAETGLASAFAAERFSRETRSESAAFAAQLKALASQLMEMDAEALRACCKQVVDAVRKLLAVTGKKSSERTQLATLLFSLSRYLPLVISVEAGEAGRRRGRGRGRRASAGGTSPHPRRPTPRRCASTPRRSRWWRRPPRRGGAAAAGTRRTRGTRGPGVRGLPRRGGRRRRRGRHPASPRAPPRA